MTYRVDLSSAKTHCFLRPKLPTSMQQALWQGSILRWYSTLESNLFLPGGLWGYNQGWLWGKKSLDMQKKFLCLSGAWFTTCKENSLNARKAIKKQAVYESNMKLKWQDVAKKRNVGKCPLEMSNVWDVFQECHGSIGHLHLLKSCHLPLLRNNTVPLLPTKMDFQIVFCKHVVNFWWV